MQYFKHLTAVVDDQASIGDGTKVWHFSHISEFANIGKNVIIGQNVFIGRNVSIGNGCKIQNNVSIYEGVTLEDDVFVGPSVVFTNVNMPRANIKANNFIKTLVQKGASIGANSTIVCGNTLGKNCFIGAGSLVTKSTKENGLYYGSPATWIRDLN
jgi:UDP-2-acetamido-3-amino-2,3-dideoxy-glucuronate N-acetyltransferase